MDEVALAELTALARDIQAQGLTEEEGLTAMAREAGLQKLGKAVRERLEAAWQTAAG